MNRSKWFASIVFLLLLSAPALFAQAPPPRRHVLVPKSSEPVAGLVAHTNLRVLVPESGPFAPLAAASPSELPPYAGYGYETPASFACIYRLVHNTVPGCNPNSTTSNPTGGSGAIAIVDAYDDPNAVADLTTFSSTFGLAPADLTVVYASGSQPPQDPSGGWELEESLDIEYAHAMAPNAKLFLVEADSNSFTDLFTAVLVAGQLVGANGGGEVSMSWGGSEFSNESQFDWVFTAPKVVYVGSTGDSAGIIYPAASPNVLAAGGTSISRNGNTGNFILESTWQDGGGGPTYYEARPHYQDRLAYIIGSTRGTPDISFDANPNSGAWVYDSNPLEGSTGWWIVGGTSLSAPAIAGILNSSGAVKTTTQAVLTNIYKNLNGNGYRDITYGNCGYYLSNFSVPGWDFCTGAGPKLGGGSGHNW